MIPSRLERQLKVNLMQCGIVKVDVDKEGQTAMRKKRRRKGRRIEENSGARPVSGINA
jgi:hypothetical protein